MHIVRSAWLFAIKLCPLHAKTGHSPSKVSINIYALRANEQDDITVIYFRNSSIIHITGIAVAFP